MTTVAEAYVTLRPDTKGFGAETERGIGGSLKKVAGLVGGIFAAKVGTDFFRGAIESASDLNESMTKNEVVFGKANKAVLEFAKGADAIGLSDAAALAATGTFGNLFRAVGLTENESAKFSTSLTGLAADMASFNNTSIEDALEAIRAGMVGETEPLKKFGVNMNEATLKAKAMALGLSDGKKALDSNTKAQAAYALIMEQTSLAQGDFARTSDGLANKQRIFGARMDELKAKIGQGLLPAMSALVSLATGKMLPAFDKIGKVAGQVINILFKGDFTSGPFAEDSKFVDSLFDLRDLFINDVLPVVERFVAFLRDNWQPVLIAAGAGLLLLISPLALIVAGVVAAWVKFEGFRDAVRAVAEGITQFWQEHAAQFKEIFAGIVDAASSYFGALKAVFDKIVLVVTEIWDRFGHTLLDKLRIAFDAIVDIVRGALAILTGVFDLIKAILTGKWGEAWDAVLQILWGAWEAIKGILRLGLDALALIFEAAKALISAAWSAIWNGLATLLSDAWHGYVNLLKAQIELVIGFIAGMPARITAAASGMWDGIKKAFGMAINAIIKVWNALEFKIPGFKVGPIGYDGFTLGVPDIKPVELHTGGTFHAAGIAAEGLALLRNGESVQTPEDRAEVADLLRQVVAAIRRLDDTQMRLARTG